MLHYLILYYSIFHHFNVVQYDVTLSTFALFNAGLNVIVFRISLLMLRYFNASVFDVVLF